MVIGVNHLRKFLLTAAIACWVTLSLTPAPVEAATTGKTTKKAVASKTSVKRSVASTRKSPSKVAKTPTRKTASASRRTANRVKVQMAAGKSGSLHKVAVRKNPVAHAAVQPRRSNGERLGLRSMDDPLDLNSSVALVIDQETNEVLFSKNDAAVLPIASLTKLMTGLVIAEANLDMEEMITITRDDVDTYKGSRSRLAVGSTLSRGELLHLALMSSENRAAHALGRTHPGGLDEFVRLMNRKADELGMADTRYVEPTGLSSQNQSSARDLATLVSVAYERPILRSLSTSPGYEVELGRRTLHYNNSNRLVKNPSWDIGLQKTGYISEAGRCLVMQAKVAGRQLIMVFLDSAGTLSRLRDAERVRRWVEVQTDTHPAVRPQG
ncbi:MAG: serine hydrolase [Hydrogenophaga sp.]|jgi:serine-type D-Ala-D-Ala endopeptidase (penicillin-binding protein 7)|uniref:serine hydrolase n=1 Tax=Hydrogenophaga sp. TaxID=1904254 RepID=UPI002613FAE1|nr:serine hydrolase [Hydrogenophaga sp.]MCV0437361.1 serine hydrolase [Hydrogenophaga sp.]